MTDKQMCDCNQGRLDCQCKEPSGGSLTGAGLPFGVANWSVDTSKMQVFTMPKPASLLSYEPDGKVIWRLFEDDHGLLRFEGDIHESAKSFFENVSVLHIGEIARLKADVESLREENLKLKDDSVQMKRYEKALVEWADKTEWIQDNSDGAGVPGDHRADAIKCLVDRIKGENNAYRLGLRK